MVFLQSNQEDKGWAFHVLWVSGQVLFVYIQCFFDLFQPASKQDASRSCVLYKLWFKLIQQHFSCYCHAILGTASIYSYLLCFAQNEIATIAPLTPCRNGILDGAWWTIITLVCFHTSCCTALFLDTGITHSTAEIGSIVQKGQSPKDMSDTIWLPKLAPLDNQPSTVSDFLAENNSQLEIELSVSTEILQRKGSPDQLNNFHLISWVASEAITKLYLP